MAVKVGNLSTLLSVNSLGLTRGLGAAGSTLTGFVGRIGGLTSTLLPIGAAFGALAATIKGALSVMEQFEEIDAIAKFSQETGISTEELVGLQHAAELSGVSVDALKTAQRRALKEGFAGGIAEIADRMAALETPVERAQFAYEAMGRSGQQLIPLLQLGGDAIREMVEEGKGLAGFTPVDAQKVEDANDAITRMKLSFTGLARDIVITVAPAVEFVGKTLTQVGIGARILFNDLKEFAIDSFLVLEFGWQNMGQIALIAFDTAKLGAVGFFNDVQFFFTDQIPALLTWFGDNWQSVFLTAFSFAETLLRNYAGNMQKTWQGVLDFIAGKGFDVDFTPLTEGFHNFLTELPDIPERELTAWEQQLAGSIGERTGTLLDGLGEHLNRRRAELFPDELPTEEVPVAESPLGIDELKGVKVAERGSSEAFSSIFAAMRGTAKDQPTGKLQQDQLAEAKRQTTALQRIERQPAIEIIAGTV